MPIKSLNAYINFNGTAAKAIALYERVLGAQRVNVARASDIPGMNPERCEARRRRDCRF